MKISYIGTAKGLHAQAVKNFAKGNYKIAYDTWSTILDKSSGDIVALKGLAYCCVLEDKDREARSYLDEAISYAANDPEIPNLIAIIYLQNGQVQEAIETLLEAIERKSDPLLTKTLNTIKDLKTPDSAKMISTKPLMHLTLPSAGYLLENTKAAFLKFAPIGIPVLLVLLLILLYPYMRNTALGLNIQNRGGITAATEINIKGIKEIVNARENFKIILDADLIKYKFEQLRKSISDQHHNRARILVNELFASNASFAIKERVEIMEGFIIEPTVDSVDYVPTYKEIAIAPAIYEGVMLRWQGTIANLHHQGRKKTTFDLLVNFVGQGQIEGIAAVELEGMQELNNGEKITVIGPVLGITEDNRIIMRGDKILPLS